MKKRIFSLVLSLFMILSMFAGVNINSFAASVDDLTYSISNSQVTITCCNTQASGELIIPEAIEGYSVTRIGSSAFSDCTSLTSITIPDSVTSIGSSAFSGCTSLTSITIPESVTGISDWAFSHCTSLQSITIPDSVTSFGYYSFGYCTSLTNITIGKSTKSIDGFAFLGCTSLASIRVDEANEYYSISEDGVLFNKDKTKLIICPGGYSNTEYIIPESVISIGDFAFSDCINLSSITIPDSVTSIGACAFTGASNLSDIIIPDSVQFIDGGYNLFSYNGLFSKTAYYNDKSNWENGLLYCGNYVVDSDHNLEEYIFRDGTIGIAGNTFHNNNSLTNITIPESVQNIGDWAFSSCWNLGIVTILGDVTSIGECMFYDCPALSSISLPDSVTFIGNSAFSECDSLVRIDLPESLQTIDNYAFEGCGALESIDLPESLQTVGYYAFEGCGALESVSIPAGVTRIGSGAFSACDVLSDIYYSGSEQEWNLIDMGFSSGMSDVTIHFGDICTHSFTEAKDAVDATCTQNGNTGEVSCMACGEVISSGEVIPATGHVFGDWIVEKEATCTENGSKSHRCEKCDEIIDVTEISATGHTFGEWKITAEATYINEGEMTRECSACSEKETQTIEKLEASEESVDENTNIIAKYQDSTYNGEMQLEVVQELDGEAFLVLNNEKGDFENMLFDITTTVNGEKVQPDGFVLVGLPLPEGYNPEKTVVYYVANDGTGLVKMNSYCEDGYIWFETNHFSAYAIVNETAPEYTPGDVNGDGKVTAADARTVLRVSAKLETLDENDILAADVNKDSKITAADARIILRVSAKLETLE